MNDSQNAFYELSIQFDQFMDTFSNGLREHA